MYIMSTNSRHNNVIHNTAMDLNHKLTKMLHFKPKDTKRYYQDILDKFGSSKCYPHQESITKEAIDTFRNSKAATINKTLKNDVAKVKQVLHALVINTEKVSKLMKDCKKPPMHCPTRFTSQMMGGNPSDDDIEDAEPPYENISTEAQAGLHILTIILFALLVGASASSIILILNYLNLTYFATQYVQMREAHHAKCSGYFGFATTELARSTFTTLGFSEDSWPSCIESARAIQRDVDLIRREVAWSSLAMAITGLFTGGYRRLHFLVGRTFGYRIPSGQHLPSQTSRRALPSSRPPQSSRQALAAPPTPDPELSPVREDESGLDMIRRTYGEGLKRRKSLKKRTKRRRKSKRQSKKKRKTSKRK